MLDIRDIAQLVAIPAFIAYSTTLRLSVGIAPGKPRQTGQTAVFGGAPKAVEQAQNAFVAVFNSTCTSRPITASKP
jgi:hypothetical protein